MTASWRRRASAAAALVLVALAVALAGVAWREAQSLEESERGRAMLRTLVAFEKDLNAATVAQRDFLLTSSPANQTEYRNRLRLAEHALGELRRLAQSHSGFSEGFARLERAAQTAHTDLDDAVARFSAGAPAADTLAASEMASRTLNLAVHDVQQRLRGELAENSAQLSTTLLYTLPGLLLVFAILAPLAAYGFVSARAELLAKRRNEHALKATNAELEARVRERTAELVEREARYRSLVADIPGSVYRCRNDRDFTMLVVSDGVQDLTGYPPSDFLERGRSFARLIDPEDADRVLDSLQCAVAQREPFELVYRIRHADGGIRWVHERGRGVHDANGELLFLDGIVFDVTVQHEAEARLHAVHRTLAESERRFRQMAETIDDVFWMATPDLQQLLYVSPAFERVWGMRCNDLYENPRLWFEAIHADDADRVREGLAAISAGIVCDVEWRIGRPDGDERWIHGRGFPVCEADGSVVLAAGIGVDITRRKAGEAELQAARRETEAALDVASRKNVLLYGALRTQAEFLGRVSHELKTPLNAVIGFSELLLSGFAGELPEEQRQHVQEIYVAGEQLLSRITDVLDLAGAQSGDTALTIESVDPDALVVAS